MHREEEHARLERFSDVHSLHVRGCLFYLCVVCITFITDGLLMQSIDPSSESAARKRIYVVSRILVKGAEVLLTVLFILLIKACSLPAFELQRVLASLDDDNLRRASYLEDSSPAVSEWFTNVSATLLWEARRRSAFMRGIGDARPEGRLSLRGRLSVFIYCNAYWSLTTAFVTMQMLFSVILLMLFRH